VADAAASSKPASPLGSSSLLGKRIVITRAVAQSSELCEELSQRGAIPESLPLVSFAAPLDFGPLDAALGRWQEFDWILFTSANAVQSVVSRSTSLGLELDGAAKRPRIAAVGPATKNETTKAGLRLDHVAQTHLGVALAQELASRLGGSIVFLPRSDRANPDLPVALKKLGVHLTEVCAYRTLPPSDLDRNHVKKVIGHQAHAAIFFSPSAVHNLADLIGKRALSELHNKITIAAVGPVTSAALNQYGVLRVVTARDTTTAAVVAALESHFKASVGELKPLAGVKRG
jgi:uroporphyrinogen-III synthase